MEASPLFVEALDRLLEARDGLVTAAGYIQTPGAAQKTAEARSHYDRKRKAVLEYVGALQELERPLPKGISPTAKGQGSPAVSVAQEEGVPEGHFEVAAPEFSGIQTQVQHPQGSGKPPCDDPGVLGVTNLQARDGRFRVILALTHADGTSLAAIMGPDDYLAFGEVYTSAGAVLARPKGVA